MHHATAVPPIVISARAHALEALRDQITRDGFAFLAASATQPLLGGPGALADWPTFAQLDAWSRRVVSIFRPVACLRRAS